jgi:trimeric autotransporter adhesin
VPGAHPLASRAGLQSHVVTRLPVGLAAAASASIGAAERGFWPVRDGGSLRTRGGGIHGTFTAAGASLRVGEETLGFSLIAVGHGQHVERIGAPAPSSAASQVLYRNGPISEFYRNGPYGLEQGFTLARSPQAGTGALVLTLRVGGSLIPEQVGSQILFRTHAGVTVLRYGQLSAQDATGRRLPAVMLLRNVTLQLRIDDRHARFPLRIDPFIQQGPKLTGAGESIEGYFGISVALSADGNTALIGGSGSFGFGAVWVFTRSGTTWTQQGSKLTGAGESGGGLFGYSVALSGEGNTALVGGYNDNDGVGAAWVFGAPPAPMVSSVSPTSGSVNGGTPIKITGTGFVAGATVEIGQGDGAGSTAIPASEVVVVSPTEITAVTGGSAKAGTYNLFVIDSEGTSPANPGDKYTYQ